MATFDAFALATAIGIRAPGLGLRIGPLPISVRTPASIALGASSVAAITGAQVDIALGASSPFIVSGWHDRDWSHSAARMRETIECLRPILRGERSDYDGTLVRSHGFRLRNPLPHSRIGVGAFGPSMTEAGGSVRRRSGAESGFAATGLAGPRTDRARTPPQSGADAAARYGMGAGRGATR